MKHSMMEKAANVEEIKVELNELRNNYHTMMLSTKASHGAVESSYAPYIYFNHKYYIILSQIATHYDNVVQNQVFQGMILEDEKSALNLFFRKRAIFTFNRATQTQNEEVINAFVLQHGDLVSRLLKMNFDIFELDFMQGRVILGPGKAFTFDEQETCFEQLMGSHAKK